MKIYSVELKNWLVSHSNCLTKELHNSPLRRHGGNQLKSKILFKIQNPKQSRQTLTICSADVERKSLLWTHLERCSLPAEHVQSTLISTHWCPCQHCHITVTTVRSYSEQHSIQSKRTWVLSWCFQHELTNYVLSRWGRSKDAAS